MVEAQNPLGVHPTSISNVYKVFQLLDMLWMGIWMCPRHITAAHVDHACCQNFARILGNSQATNHGEMR